MGFMCWTLTFVVAPILLPFLGAFWVGRLFPGPPTSRKSPGLFAIVLGLPWLAAGWASGGWYELFDRCSKTHLFSAQIEALCVLEVVLLFISIGTAVTGIAREPWGDGGRREFTAFTVALTFVSAAVFTYVHWTYAAM
ncbi:hypothetical protein OKW39_001227 [Paraburkholderia sp. MM6662-R1]